MPHPNNMAAIDLLTSPETHNCANFTRHVLACTWGIWLLRTVTRGTQMLGYTALQYQTYLQLLACLTFHTCILYRLHSLFSYSVQFMLISYRHRRCDVLTCRGQTWCGSAEYEEWSLYHLSQISWPKENLWRMQIRKTIMNTSKCFKTSALIRICKLINTRKSWPISYRPSLLHWQS